MALRAGLIGTGISRSRMPKLQQYLGKLNGVDFRYSLIDLADRMRDWQGSNEDLLRAAVTAARDDGCCGLNITHPFKQVAWSLADHELLEGHAGIGAYNTLLLQDKRICGANTDYSGFMRGYRHRIGSAAPGNVLLAGAGGVGRAAAFALKELCCRKLWIHDIDSRQSGSLASALNAQGLAAEVVPAQDLDDITAAVDGLLNCTSLGMFQYPGSVFNHERLHASQWAFDAVYTPLYTPFMSACRDKGLRCMTGYDLWISQGLDAFRIFTGIDTLFDEALARETLSWVEVQ
jgi:shikimate dehydrogenase